MPVAEWYVAQVRAGQDDVALSAIRQLAEEGVLERCFSPRYETQQKVRGEYRRVERRLIPGYLIVVTDAPERLERDLAGYRGFAKILKSEKGFIPLHEEERAWIAKFTEGEECLVPMSTAVKDGDEVVVTEGPLLGRTFRIKRIDRHRSMAYIEVNFLGRPKEVPVGLKIVAKRTNTNE